jgi:hypothetical protein
MSKNTVQIGCLKITTPEVPSHQVRADMVELCNEGAEILGDPNATDEEKNIAVEMMTYAANAIVAIDEEEAE